MLGLLSRASIQKDNPSRERTTAQAVGRELKLPDFLVTLNVDGLQATEIPWQLSEINYIAFSRSWADGLVAVVKKLESVNTPRALSNGAALATESLDTTRFVRQQSERLCSNCLTVRQVPEVIQRYSAAAAVMEEDASAFRGRWACRRVSSDRLLAFEPPPAEIQQQFQITSAGGACWRCMPRVDDIDARDLAVSLVHASIDCLFAARGLVFSPQQWAWHVPAGLLGGDWLRYQKQDGTTGRALAVGERTYRSGSNREPYRYHVSPYLSVMRGTADPFVLVLRNRVYLTDAAGKPLDGRKVNSRRKHLCKNWWNDDWLARTLGVIRLLAGDDDCIRIGITPATQIIIESTPLTYDVPISVDETDAEPPDPDFVPDDEVDEVDSGGDE
jgi:hypothetical protein